VWLTEEVDEEVWVKRVLACEVQMVIGWGVGSAHTPIRSISQPVHTQYWNELLCVQTQIIRTPK
jgi:hypothetical protein